MGACVRARAHPPSLLTGFGARDARDKGELGSDCFGSNVAADASASFGAILVLVAGDNNESRPRICLHISHPSFDPPNKLVVRSHKISTPVVLLLQYIITEARPPAVTGPKSHHHPYRRMGQNQKTPNKKKRSKK